MWLSQFIGDFEVLCFFLPEGKLPYVCIHYISPSALAKWLLLSKCSGSCSTGAPEEQAVSGRCLHRTSPVLLCREPLTKLGIEGKQPGKESFLQHRWYFSGTKRRFRSSSTWVIQVAALVFFSFLWYSPPEKGTLDFSFGSNGSFVCQDSQHDEFLVEVQLCNQSFADKKYEAVPQMLLVFLCACPREWRGPKPLGPLPVNHLLHDMGFRNLWTNPCAWTDELPQSPDSTPVSTLDVW